MSRVVADARGLLWNIRANVLEVSPLDVGVNPVALSWPGFRLTFTLMNISEATRAEGPSISAVERAKRARPRSASRV